MNEPLTAYMQVGIVHFMAYPATMKGEGPIAESVAQIASDDFFQAIEITWVKDAEERARVKSILEQSHLTVGFGAQPSLLTTGLDLNALDKGARQAAVAQIKSMVDMAHEMGIRRIAFLSGKDPGAEQRAAATQALVDSLDEICEYAASRDGMMVILETFDRTVDKRALIGPSEEAAAVAARVRAHHANFGLMLDLSHLPQQFEDPGPALRNVRDYLVHVHIGNCVTKDRQHPAYGDQHPRFGLPGGDVDVPQVAEFLQELLHIGYLDRNKKELPVVAFEVKPMAGESSEVVVANAKRTLLAAWKLVE